MAKYDCGFLVDLISGSNDDNDSRGKEMFSLCSDLFFKETRDFSFQWRSTIDWRAAMHIFAFKPVSNQFDCLSVIVIYM